MIINFRQGVVRAPPGFLSIGSNAVNLVIPPNDQLIATVADGASNYLITERLSIPSAWTGITSGTDRWIYIDLHPITGERTFGSTLFEPAEGVVAPVAPANDQHWFDTVTNTMKVWVAIGNKWVRKVRVFVAKMQGGSVAISMSVNAPLFTGTQVGDTTTIRAGSLLYDDAGVALKKSTGEFFTTEDSAVAVDGSNSQVKFASQVILATAGNNIPAYSVVKFSDFNTVILGTAYVVGDGRYGFTENAAATGEIVQVVLDGTITNPSWDWSNATVGDPLYVNGTGQLSLTPTSSAEPVAIVISQTTVMLRPSAMFGVSAANDNLTALAELTDVVLTTPANGEALVFNGTEWVNTIVSTAVDLNGLTDVTITTPANGEALVFNGTEWVNAIVSTATDLDGLIDVDLTTTPPVTNDVLQFNGTSWIPAPVAAGGGGDSGVIGNPATSPNFILFGASSNVSSPNFTLVQ